MNACTVPKRERFHPFLSTRRAVSRCAFEGQKTTLGARPRKPASGTVSRLPQMFARPMSSPLVFRMEPIMERPLIRRFMLNQEK